MLSQAPQQSRARGTHLDGRYPPWRPWDIWLTGCNYGANVNVILTKDNWHYGFWNGDWRGRSWNPSTYHCHCP